MAQNIAFFLFSRKLLRDSEKAAEAADAAGDAGGEEEIALGEEARSRTAEAGLTFVV